MARLIAKEVRSELHGLIHELYPPLEPELPEEEPTDRLIFGTTQAGQDYRYTVASRFYPLSVYCRVQTDGTVGDRNVAVEYRDGSNVRFLVAGCPVTLAAGQTQVFNWHPKATTPQWPVTDAALAPLPQLWLS